MTNEDELELQNNLERANALNRLLLDTSKSQNNTIGHFKAMLITLIICFSIIICTMIGGFFWYESQFDAAETTTTTMTTDGDNANINAVTDGDQTLRKEGRPFKQAAAIALSKAGRSKKNK